MQFQVEPYIVAVTAYDTDEVLQKCLDSGIKDVMFKPVEFDKLVGQLTKIARIQGVDLLVS